LPFSARIPYIAVDLGIQETTIINLGLKNGLSMVKENNSLVIPMTFSFPSSIMVQNSISGLFSDIYLHGWGKTTQSISMLNLRLGFSAEDCVAALSKAVVRLKSSLILSQSFADWVVVQLGFPGGTQQLTNATYLLSTIDIQGATMDLHQPKLITIDCSAFLDHIPFDLQVYFPLFEMDVFLNDVPFGNARLVDLDLAPQQSSRKLLSRVKV
jgi:hypothetical protein